MSEMEANLMVKTAVRILCSGWAGLQRNRFPIVIMSTDDEIAKINPWKVPTSVVLTPSYSPSCSRQDETSAKSEKCIQMNTIHHKQGSYGFNFVSVIYYRNTVTGGEPAVPSIRKPARFLITLPLHCNGFVDGGM